MNKKIKNLHWHRNVAYADLIDDTRAKKENKTETAKTNILYTSLIAFRINNPILYIVGIYFLNYTMPINLSAIANIQKNREVFSFWLTTLAFIIGCNTLFSEIKLTSERSLIVFGFVVLSAIFIYFGLKLICRKVS